MVSRFTLSDSKSTQISNTLLSILAGLNNAVIWMVSTCPLISKSSNPSINPLGIVPITIGITVTFMFQFFFSSLARSTYLFLFQFYSVVCPDSKVHNSVGSKFPFFIFCSLLLDLVVWPGLDDLIVSQNLRKLCASHSPGLIIGCTYTICLYGQI